MGQELERIKLTLGFTAAFTTSAKESRYVKEAMDCVIERLYSQEKRRQKTEGEVDEEDLDALIGSLTSAPKPAARGRTAAAMPAAAGGAGVASAAAGAATSGGAVNGGVVDLTAMSELDPARAQAGCCY